MIARHRSSAVRALLELALDEHREHPVELPVDGAGDGGRDSLLEMRHAANLPFVSA